MDAVFIADPDQREQITLDIMRQLPDWFSPPEDIDRKAKLHRGFPFFAVLEGSRAVGFAALKIHNAYTAELYTIGVLEGYHRQGAGHALIQAALSDCKSRGLVYLTVKTLDQSANYPPYDRTRAFYLKEGFIPLEMFPLYWNKDNPCLFLVRPVS